MRPLRLGLSALSLLGLAVLLAGYLGRWWPPGDSLAVGRLQVLAAAVPVLAGLWRAGGRRLAGLGLALCLVGFAHAGWVALAPCLSCRDGPADVTVYQKNLRFDGTDRAALVADIIASGADLITLQEVSRANLVVLSDLDAAYPYRHLCPFSGVGGIAILSRLPLTAPECPVPGLATARVALAAGDFVVASVHLYWPFPFDQHGQVERIRAALGDPARLILGGDFNMQPWGWAVRGLPGDRIGGLGVTFPRFLPWVPLIIDHVKAAGLVGRSELRPLLGSDHYGVLARLQVAAD